MGQFGPLFRKIVPTFPRAPADTTGPCPPAGPAHHYRFTVYALQRQPEVAGDADPGTAVEAIEAAATARGRLVSTFGR